ncbi:MAG: DNA-binding domain-containing protein [Bacteroidota bacterium]
MATNEKSSVIVELQDLAITERKDDRFGRVVTTRSLNEDDLVDIVVSRGTEVSAATIKSALEKLKKVAIEQIANGASVRFGLGYFNLGVNGVFIGDSARWDPNIHSLNVNVTPVAELRDSVRASSVEVRGLSASGLAISSVTDVTTGEENKRLTPGGIVNLTGTRMRVEGEGKGVGISLINQANGEAVAIPMNSIGVNDPSFISFVVPANLIAGDYKLSLTTQFSAANVTLKEGRTFLFEYVLNVS